VLLQIKSKGGLSAIVISHPHYYTTLALWAEVFDCPVYLSAEDQEWICGPALLSARLKLIKETTESILPGVTAVKLGGHFDGSLVLHWKKKLFIADTFVTVPVGLPSHQAT